MPQGLTRFFVEVKILGAGGANRDPFSRRSDCGDASDRFRTNQDRRSLPEGVMAVARPNQAVGDFVLHRAEHNFFAIQLNVRM